MINIRGDMDWNRCSGHAALAAGGFTTAAALYIFNRQRYHALVRPALLTALLGYTFVGLGIMMDIGLL